MFTIKCDKCDKCGNEQKFDELTRISNGEDSIHIFQYYDSDIKIECQECKQEAVI